MNALVLGVSAYNRIQFRSTGNVGKDVNELVLIGRLAMLLVAMATITINMGHCLHSKDANLGREPIAKKWCNNFLDHQVIDRRMALR